MWIILLVIYIQDGLTVTLDRVETVPAALYQDVGSCTTAAELHLGPIPAGDHAAAWQDAGCTEVKPWGIVY